jgi:Tfp pilus assembly protein PilF
MIRNFFKTTGKSLRTLLLLGAAFVAAASCLSCHKTPPSSKPAARQHVDAKAQRQYYDLGLQQYSRENYGEAKEAFEQAIEFGPNTALGVKAKENLKKIERILKTLEEMESK